jgi:hypothetical protein
MCNKHRVAEEEVMVLTFREERIKSFSRTYCKVLSPHTLRQKSLNLQRERKKSGKSLHRENGLTSHLP